MRALFILTLFCLPLSMMSCSAPSSEGYAPSEIAPEEPIAENPPTNPPAATDWEQQIHFSESNTINSWNLTLNTSDSTYHQTLANGWSIEATYE